MRVIGGVWRGSKISFPDAQGLRPTPDRVRETLFNWLAPRLRGASVLDCCAGSGVLGLEAASRGAAPVLMVERQADAADLIRQNAQRLGAVQTEVRHGDVLCVLNRSDGPFDIALVDPPYAMPELRDAIIGRLLDLDLLNPGCWIYLEWPLAEGYELNVSDLTWIKRKTAGALGYAIAQWQ